MNYKTIELIKEFFKNFTYINPCESEERTFEWTDAWFGYRESEFSADCESGPYAKHYWDEGARQINTSRLRRGEDILSLGYYQTSRAIEGSGRGTLTDKYTFSYQKGIGFINNFTKRTLQQVLNLTEEQTILLNSTFENEEEFKVLSLSETNS